MLITANDFSFTANVTPFMVGFWSATNGAVFPGANQLSTAIGFNLMYTQVPC
jgi:hypothetical protein